MPLKMAFESVKAVARQVEVSRTLCPIQVTENVRDPARLISTNLTRVAVVEKFQAPGAGTSLSQYIVPCTGIRINESSRK